MTWENELRLDIVPPTQLYDGLSTEKSSFFSMNGKCYIMDGTVFFVYHGEEIKAVEP